MFDYFIKGGPLMYPIGILSIISLTIILERTYHFLRFRSCPDGLLSKTIFFVKQKKWREAEDFLNKETGPLAKLLLVLTQGYKEGKGEVGLREVANLVASREISRMERHLSLLPLVYQLAPLLGLLGTVTGMIKAFQVIERMGGKVNALVLAGGIWEAMITTAAGLMVAIPTAFFYHFLERKVERTAKEIQDAATEFIFSLKGVDE
ncbi:MAG: MotA/TolQ/ExbB proton channel family protein [Deltaproteobacteria bacterium]|nr:MotA/TolQ/ExbB proton channel family protein [Deltaproteobacteria bacterium]